jgi:hypothetical protein
MEQVLVAENGPFLPDDELNLNQGTTWEAGDFHLSDIYDIIENSLFQQ